MKTLSEQGGKPSYSRRIGAIVTLFVILCFAVVLIGIVWGSVSWDSTPAVYLVAGEDHEFVPAVKGVSGVMTTLIGFVGVTALPYMTNQVSGALRKGNGNG